MTNFRVRPRFPGFTVQFLLSGRLPEEAAHKARACVNYDRRLDEIAKSRRAR